MPATSNKIGAFPTPQSKSTLSSSSAYRSPATVKIVEKQLIEVEKPSAETSYSIESKSDSRMLQARGICQSRLEMLALLDFQPLFEGNRRTATGNLANIRQTLRDIDRRAAMKIISDFKASNEAAYKNAVNIYESNLSSAQVEYELLKSSYLMKEYASRAFSFNSHIKNLILSSQSGINLGRTGYDFYNVSLNFKQDPTIQSNNASVNFLQLLADISAFSRFGFPAVIGSKVRQLKSDAVIFDLGVSSKMGTTTAQQSVRLARELAASCKLKEVRSGEGEEKELHAKFKSVIGSDFFNSPTVPVSSVFEKLFGFDTWYQDSAEFFVSPRLIQPKTIGTMASLGGLAGAIDYEPSGLMLLEDQTRTYGSKTYLPPDSLVNTAFKPATALNFNTYKAVSEKFYTICSDSSALLRNLYYPGFSYRGNYRYNLAGQERLTSLSVFEAVCISFRDRFLSNNLSTSLYGGPESFSSSKSKISYIQNMAHLFMRDRPDAAAKILFSFAQDYLSGDLNTDETKTSKTQYEKISNLAKSKVLLTEWYNTREKIAQYVPPSQNTPSAQRDPEIYCPRAGDWRALVAITKNESDNITTIVYENQILFEVIAYGVKILSEILNRFSTTVSLSSTGESLWPNSGVAIQVQSGKSTAVVPNTPQQSQVPDPYYDSEGLRMLSTDQSMNSYTWIPVIRDFISKFFRSNSSKTFSGGMSLLEVFKGIYSIHSTIMGKEFSMLKVKTARVRVRYGSSGSKTRSGEYASNPGYTLDANIAMIASNQNISLQVGNTAGVGYKVAFDQALRRSSITAKDALGQQFGARLASVINLLTEDEIKLKTSISILTRFSERVQSFSSSAIDTFTGSTDDTNPVYEFLTRLAALGSPGLDILENLTPEQICLKSVTTRRQAGIKNYEYLPAISFVSPSEKRSIECLASNRYIKAPEGLNLRCLSVGIPAGMLKSLGLSNKFSIMLKMADLEFNDVVFSPKQYNFDSTLFVNTDSFETVRNFSNFTDLVGQTRFLNSSLSVQEVPGNSPRLSLTETSRFTSPSNSDFDVFSNTAASALMEIYYRLLLGLEMTEDTFESVAGNMSIPLNSYAKNLAGAIAAFAADVQVPGTKVSSAVKNSNNIVSGTAVKEAQATGEITELDAEFVASIRNSFTTRLLSAEDMRDTILKAKVFDRIFHLLVDPDEFTVATKRNPVDGVFTPDTVIDKMVKNKTLVSFVENGVQYYKLTPRKVAEGRMAFAKFIASVEPSTPKGTLVVKP
jgi:hypothetical protein